MRVRNVTVAIAVAFAIIATVTAVLVAMNATAAEERWYTSEQVAAGSHLYVENCQVCHGENGVGNANWRQRQADGTLPPPPLNGTAHTWHHPLDALRRSVNDGGTAFGGVMPGFGDILSEAERDAVLAYVQSLWPDEIYHIWAEKVERK